MIIGFSSNRGQIFYDLDMTGSSANNIISRLRKLIYLRREFIMFSGDMTSEEWFKAGGEPPRFEPKIDVEIRLGTLEDIERMGEFLPRRKINMFRKWFKDGNDLFVGLHDGRIVYYQWLMYNDFYDPFAGMVVKLKKDEVLPVDIYTAPEFRFKDIHLAANCMTIARCRDLGRYRMVALSAPEKFPLLKLWYRKTGLGHIHPKKHIVYHRVLKFIKFHSIVDIDGQAPYRKDQTEPIKTSGFQER